MGGDPHFGMEFSAWQQWSGVEVAKYVTTVCELPQYSAAIKESLTGAALQQLLDGGMLLNALARAGVTEVAHQKKIRAAFVSLSYREPADLSKEFQRKLTVRPPPFPHQPHPPPHPSDRPVGSPSGFRRSQYGRASQARTPASTLPPLAAAPAPPSAGTPSSAAARQGQLPPLSPHKAGAAPRGSAANSRRDSQEDTAASADRALREEHAAATKIQAMHRGNKARQEQAQGRDAGEAPAEGTAAGAEASEEQNAAATKLQAAQRGRQARQEVQAMRQEKDQEATGAPAPAGEAAAAGEASSEELSAAATRLQAAQRGKQARQEVQAMREAEEREERERAVVATKLQAAQRGKQARQEVQAMREAEERQERERAVAATKLQAAERGRQARREMAAAS